MVALVEHFPASPQDAFQVVTPAQAGIQYFAFWIPARAGMTNSRFKP